MEKIIEIIDLTKKYGDFTAVDHLTLDIYKGEVFGLLGPNGAGKSTTILMMLGLTDPSSGKVTVCGINATHNPIKVKRKVGYLPEDVGFYDDRTALENLIYTACLNGSSITEARVKAKDILNRVGLDSAMNKKAGTFSRGMRQRLGFADILIKNPEVIIMDEPTLGIDPEGIKEFLHLIIQLSKSEHITVLLSSHNLHQVQQICDRVGLFVGGKLLAEGDIDSLSKKLFDSEPFAVEAGITPGKGQPSIAQLKSKLSQQEGIINVKVEEGMLHIGCEHDMTGEIARLLTKEGASLNFLQKKEYRLDDIYHRYFEEGENHG